MGAHQDDRLRFGGGGRCLSHQGVRCGSQVGVALPGALHSGCVQTGKDPSPLEPSTFPAVPTDQQNSGCCLLCCNTQPVEDGWLNASTGDSVDRPGAEVLKEQPATRLWGGAGYRITPLACRVRATEARLVLPHSTVARPASTNRRARSRPRSSACAVPLSSKVFIGATSSSRSGILTVPVMRLASRSWRSGPMGAAR